MFRDTKAADEQRKVLVEKIWDVGIHGMGPWKSARSVADEALTASANDADAAVRRVISTHRRVVGTSGFVTGVGGPLALVVAVPADLTAFYTSAARMTAAIAHIRGYDLDSEEVRSIVLVSLLGAAGANVLAEAGVKVATKSATTLVQKVPGRVLIEINKKVGFRLVTKFGQKGVVNLVKVVPVVGGGVGASVNVAGLNAIAHYAKVNFPENAHSAVLYAVT